MIVLYFFFFVQIVIAVVAALVVLMICAVFGLWYNNRKYVPLLMLVDAFGLFRLVFGLSCQVSSFLVIVLCSLG